MKKIYFSGNYYTSPVDWCILLLYEIRANSVDTECLELCPLHKDLDTESILNEMSVDDLKIIVRTILEFYK